MERRDFLKGAAIGALGMFPMGAALGCSQQQASGEASAQSPSAEKPDLQGVVTENDRPLSVEEMNKMRQEIIDSKTDYVCEDGTVIPAVYVKLKALTSSVSLGDSTVHDGSFNALMADFSEEEAQAYLEMPWGVRFTAADYAAKSGRPEAECLELCEDLASRCLLYRTRRCGVSYFNIIPECHGFYEYGIGKFSKEYLPARRMSIGKATTLSADTGLYYTLPVGKEVLAEGEGIIPHDDWHGILDRNSLFARLDCCCRLAAETMGEKEEKGCTHDINICLATGEEAEYYIENNIAREITREEARELLTKNVESGLVIQTCYTKDSEAICSCHGECCGVLSSYVALGDAMADLPIAKHLGHYSLVYDEEKCISCGACVKRCPMFTITMDEENHPQIGATCIGCGQCALVCPAEARKLVQKDAEDIPYLPQDMLDDYNHKAEFRFKAGTIF